MKIYHNPRCRKSRETLALIEEKGIQPDIELYLDNNISIKELKELLKKLGMEAKDLVRKTEAVYKEQFKGKTLTEAEWLQAITEHPKLMQRPIVVKGNKAVLGRPPENVLELL